MFHLFLLFFTYFCAPANKSQVQAVTKYRVIDQSISTCNKAEYLNCVNVIKGGQLECANKHKCSADVLADVENPNAILQRSNVSPTASDINPSNTYPGQMIWDPGSGTYVPVVANSQPQIDRSNEIELNRKGYATPAQCAATLESCMQYLGGVDACYSGDSSEKRYQCPKNDGKYPTYIKIENDNASSPTCKLSALRICLNDKGGDACYTKGNDCKSYRIFSNKK